MSEKTDAQKLSIQFGWLVYEVGEHTCGGYGPESGYKHEPGCGFEPIMTVEELDALLTDHAQRMAPSREQDECDYRATVQDAWRQR